MTTTHLSRFWALTAVALALLAAALLRTATSSANDDVFARSLAMYAALRSYADTGTVEVQYGLAKDPARDRHTFTTYFSRAPRGFYFDFNKNFNKNGGVDRYVIWGDPEAFHTWWKAINVKSDHPNPNNTGAFVAAGQQTAGSAMIIPPLLYSKAGLQAEFTNIKNPVVNGTETISGHQCYRVVATTSDVYGATGREVNIRNLTISFDVQSLLIRKLVVEPKDTIPGQINRRTTTFESQANPTLDASRFKFVPPGPK